MSARSIDRRAKKTGPIANTEGIPYDYIVIIDSGSSGSRAYVYNWLNARSVYEKSLNLVDRVVDTPRDDDEDSSDSDEEGLNEDMQNVKGSYKLPQVRTRPKWKKKIKPGVSSFNNSPGKVGKEHIKPLLDSVSAIVPKSQHSRTPIFLHATAGMRLLNPNEQKAILNNICKYIVKNYDFYLPDCESHVNIIDGDVEGLYGWIAANYLMGSFDHPSMHDHGKNHSTYGLLDMGGASTQISFQPNSTEQAEHANALFKIQLSSKGQFESDLNYNVFSTSFLGFGINEAHENYIQRLQNSSVADENPENLIDPCLPKGLHEGTVLGVGNFTQCMQLIYPLLIESENSDTASCSMKNPQDISSCMLSNSIPALDFDVDKFIGVSGYWDAVSNMLGIQDIAQYGNAYSYQSFYLETEKICETPWAELDHYNDEEVKTSFGMLSDTELAQLCFKSSWILNVLHRGLGFPQLEATVPDTNANITPFRVAEAINGSEFSWTLGRAILYATWEQAQWYAVLNHVTEDARIGYYHASSPNLFIYGGEQHGVAPRPSYDTGQSHAGHEDEHSNSHDNHANGADTSGDDDDDDEWELQDIHRSYSSLIILAVLVAALYAILGPKKRTIIWKSVKKTATNATRKLGLSQGRYARLGAGDVELNDISGTANNSNNNNTVDLENEINETFNISDEDD